MMPGRRQQLALQRELTREGEPSSAGRRHLRGRREHRRRDREIEAGTFLAEVGRRQVHDDPAERPLQARALDGRADAVARVVHGGAGEPGEDQRGEPAPDVRLDGDEVSADAEHRDPHNPPVHDADATPRY